MSTPRPQPVFFVSESAQEAMTVAAAAAHPNETGGILIGVHQDGHPWVTTVVEIKTTERGRHHFRIPFGKTQPAVHASRRTDRRLGYLGDWHSHPNDVGPSHTDLATLGVISLRHPRQPNPTLVVVRNTTSGYRLDARRIVTVTPRPCDLRLTGNLPPQPPPRRACRKAEPETTPRHGDTAMSSPPTAVDPTEPTFTDPIFISYRKSDGSTITAELAWLLRAAGIPVWRDRDDLPPGDTEARLRQAIAEGLSGAALVITPEVAKSEVVRFVEAPELISLHTDRPAFALGIANAIERAPGKLDYEAPDTVLGLRSGTLTGVDQHPTTRPGLLLLVQKLLWHRMAHQRALVENADGTFTLSSQTRNTPQVYDRTGSQLDVRIRPSGHERLPSPEGLQDLADVIGLLPHAVIRAGARRVRITGGAHLSVALALGAALPSSRVGHIEVLDQRGEPWTSGSEAHQPDTQRLTVIANGTNTTTPIGRPAVAVYLDLIPQRSDAAFERYLEENQSTLTGWAHLRPTTDDLLDPTTAGQLAAEAAAHIRQIANANSNAEVHLLLRCPFPIAVLVGRLMNTLRLVAYEWDDSAPTTGNDYRPRYIPTLSVRASAAAGVIDAVHLTT